MGKKLICMLVVLLAVEVEPALAQVTARQGVASEPEIVQFESPMVLDVPLPDVTGLKGSSQARLPEVRKYRCDRDVSLLGLSVGRKFKGPKKARSLSLVISGWVLVVDSYDRRADIGVRLRSGDTLLGSQILRNHKTEEGRTTPFRILLPVKEPQLLEGNAADPKPMLEITLTVRDDS